jgi:sugar phosphate permease
LLTEARHIRILHAAWMLAGFEIFGLIGALLGGWITDRFLGGRAVRACVVYMALAGVSILLFWKIQTQSELLITGLLCATGFFVYGPQCLLAIACANLATKRAAATAVGLTRIFGYASTVLSGWGFGCCRIDRLRCDWNTSVRDCLAGQSSWLQTMIAGGPRKWFGILGVLAVILIIGCSVTLPKVIQNNC